ncbi:MAG: hypothetical protein WDW36_003643 [Sanguina aurantia]
MAPDHPTIGCPLPALAGGPVYLDYNATTPCFPEVAEAMAPFLGMHFGNPSSGHTYGRVCKAALDTARAQVAQLINASPSEIYFCSCGTEADNWAIYGAVTAKRRSMLEANGGLPHVVTSAIEHIAVLAYLQHLSDQKLCTFTAVPVSPSGMVCPQDVAAALTPNTVLVSIMHSNNEVGSLQPIREIAAVAAAAGVLMHTDAAQSIGKVGVDVKLLGVDMLSLVGHKFGAPKGVAALFIRNGVTLPSFLYGGGQEGGRRAGTENVLLIVGLGAAAQLAAGRAQAARHHMEAMRDRLQRQLLEQLPKDRAAVNGPSESHLRLPNTLSISISGFSASTALHQLRDALAVSAGSACHSASSISHVLKAMQILPEAALGTLRCSTHAYTTDEDVSCAVKLIVGEASRQWDQQH